MQTAIITEQKQEVVDFRILYHFMLERLDYPSYLRSIGERGLESKVYITTPLPMFHLISQLFFIHSMTIFVECQYALRPVVMIMKQTVSLHA